MHTATTELYTLSLHDALPIFGGRLSARPVVNPEPGRVPFAISFDQSGHLVIAEDRKSTRLNSSHSSISYAVFCLKKKRQYSPYYNSVTLAAYYFTQTLLMNIP